MLDALRGPYSARLFVSSMVGRVPAAALGLVFVVRTKELTGSFAAAGAASGLNAIANAVSSPALGRLVDRRGQPLVLLSGAAACALALAVFATLREGATLAAIAPCALVAGATMPPLGACLRALWPSLLGDQARVHAAFALESAMLELTYIAGPVLIVGAIGAWSTAASASACAVLLVAGTVVFATAAPVRAWRPQERSESHRAGALRGRGVRTLIGMFLFIGAAFGAVEVAVPAAADAAGHANAAGALLGVWGLGSFCGGLLAAHAGPPADRIRRLCLLLAALAAGHALLALPVGLLGLAVLLFAAGGAIAPSFGLAYGLVDSIAPAGTVTEAYSWLTSGITAGLAAGAALAGTLAQASGAGAGFLLSAAAAAGAAVFAATRRTTLERTPAPA